MSEYLASGLSSDNLISCELPKSVEMEDIIDTIKIQSPENEGLDSFVTIVIIALDDLLSCISWAFQQRNVDTLAVASSSVRRKKSQL